MLCAERPGPPRRPRRLHADTVGAGAFTIGMLIAVYDFAELFAKPAAGIVADRRGMKPVLLIGLVVFIGGSLLFLIVNPRLLLLVRFVHTLPFPFRSAD